MENTVRPIPKRKWIPLYTDWVDYRRANRDIFEYIGSQVNRYGDVCNVSFLGLRNYYVHDPDVIKEILVTQAGSFRRTYLYKALRRFFGKGLFTSDGAEHRSHKRSLKPAFYPQRIAGYAEIMVCSTKEETAGWKHGDILDINASMARITMKIICRSLFGADVDPAIIERFRTCLTESFDTLNEILRSLVHIICLEKDIPLPLVQRFRRFKSELDKLVAEMIALYRERNDPTRDDIMTLMMFGEREGNGGPLTDEALRSELITVLIGGHETSSLGLSWAWWLIGTHPEIERQFHEELTDQLGNRDAGSADYPNLVLTRNIFRETLRLYPPSWIFTREAAEDVTIKGYHFPKGSVICSLSYLVHRKERYFEEPGIFKPGRWLDEKIKTLPKFAFFPFGGGQRGCMGEGFAWMEALMIMTTIGRQFRLEPLSKTPPEKHPVFTLKTKQPILARIITR